MRLGYNTLAATVLDAPAQAHALTRYEQLVSRCCQFIEENLRKPLMLDDLCQIADSSPRTIEYAFSTVIGTSPMAWYRDQRFDAAHRALQHASPDRVLVTDVATRFSFWHLGRFSVEYRSRFGESPSTTLQQLRETT